MKEGPSGSVHRFPKIPHANDNEVRPYERHPGMVFDRAKERDLQTVFNRHREENPRAWTQEQLDVYRRSLSIVTDESLIKRLNESTPHQWNIDPRYFFVILEYLNAPDEPDG